MVKRKILSLFLTFALITSIIVFSQPLKATPESNPAQGVYSQDKVSNGIFYLNWKSSKIPTSEFRVEGIAGDYKILIDEGHGQYYSGDRLATLKDVISTYFGSYIINSDNFAPLDLEGVDLIIIPNPEGNFTSEEISLLQNYLESGGSLLIMGTWDTYFEPYSFNKLTNKYGIYWNDTSMVDETDNFGGSFAQYQIKVHLWDNNPIVNEMGVADYTSAVYFDGTALTLGPYNSTAVVDGPYFVGIIDSDTYIELPNNTVLVPGVNYTKPVGFHAAAKLINGGKIFASGSTREIADPYIGFGDTSTFVKLVVAWLLDIPPENVLLPIIKDFTAPTSIKPAEKNWVNFTIENAVPLNRSNMRLKVYLPYFVEPFGNAIISSTFRDVTVPIISGGFIDLGTIYANEVISVSIPIISVLGLEESGVISVYLYAGDALIVSITQSLYSAPAIDVSADFIPFYINITKTNKSILYVNITNVVDYAVKGIKITLENIPEKVKVNSTKYLIPSLAPGDSILIAFGVEIGDIGVYEFPVIVEDLNGSTIVRRPFLLGITQKLLVFDEGHNQYIRFASPYMQGLLSIMQEYGPVLINKGEFSPAILDPTVTNLIVIPVPQPPTASPSDTASPIFTQDEILSLQQFIDNGGSLLLMGNWYNYFWPDNPNSYNDLTEPYGIHWIDGDLYDRVNNFGADYQVVLTNFANNSVAKFLSSGVKEVYYSGTGLQNVTPTKPATVYPILLGNNESFVTTGAITDENVTVGEECILVMAAETQTGGRIIASGSSYMFSDYYQFSLNKDFIVNMIAWLSKINKLTLEVSPIPAEIPIKEPIKVTVRVKNSGVQKLTNVAIDIPSLPAGKVLLKNDTHVEIGDLEPGQYVDLVFIFEGKEEGSYIIQINALVENKVRESLQIIFNFVTIKQGLNWVLIAGGVVVVVIILALAFKFVLPAIRKK